MVKILQNYLPIFVTILILLVTICSGAWRKWRDYYASILFYISIQFGISYLTYEHHLWHFQKSLITPNHVVTDFFIAFTNFVPMVLLFLSLYPLQASPMKQVRYVGVVWFDIPIARMK